MNNKLPLKEYFENEEQYSNFIQATIAQLDSLTMGGVLKLQAKMPLFKGGAMPLKTLANKGIPKQCYWYGIQKMNEFTLD